MTRSASGEKPPALGAPAMSEALGEMSVDIDRYLAHSARIQTDDLDWSEARESGLSGDESFILTYFSDIEGQTIFYLRDLLNTKVSKDTEATAFLTMWNYEEFFHGWALSHLLKECGTPLAKNRNAQVRMTSRISEAVLDFFGRVVSRILPDSFLALYMSWGAVNELTTLRGYERLRDGTENPVLKTLAERIAKQERRHFAWYFNSARERLLKSAWSRTFTRFMLRFFWTPVGVGVKEEKEAVRLIQALFPGKYSNEMGEDVDGRIGALPGLEDISLMRRFLQKSDFRSLREKILLLPHQI